MSLPRDSNEESEEQLQPLTDIGALEAIFTSFEKPRSKFGIGVEHERFIVDPLTLKPTKWHGPKGVASVMEALLSRFQQLDDSAIGILEKNELVGIFLKNSSITLEPGCQLELSGAPLETIFEIDEELTQYETIVEKILKDIGLSSLLMGFHPAAKREDFEWVPKKRYEIMRNYMPKKGSRGHDMMLRTCTVQANFDYASETDMIASFRTALLVSPIVTALFATSPFKEGKLSGFLSERSLVWHDTDPDRSGFPLEVFDSNFSYRRWIDRALDTPMYFVRRGGISHDATSTTFRDFFKHGFLGFKATYRDFTDHLTTVFTDARIKPQLEVRSADCGPKAFLRALPALWKGILYDEKSREGVLQLLSNINPGELTKHQIQVAQFGLGAKFGNRNMHDVAADLVAFSKAGLTRLHQTRGTGGDESIFLKPLEDVLTSGKNHAQIMIERFEDQSHSLSWLLDPP